MPMRSELPAAESRRRDPAPAAGNAWSRVVGDISDPDAVTVLSVYLIALLLMLNAILRYPELGETITGLSAFP